MTPSTATPADALEAMRDRLDAIDMELLDVLRRRIGVCVEIAEHKREHGVPMMQPHRIGVVQRRAAEYGTRNGISLAFLRGLYDHVIAETCRVENQVIGDREHV